MRGPATCRCSEAAAWTSGRTSTTMTFAKICGVVRYAVTAFAGCRDDREAVSTSDTESAYRAGAAIRLTPASSSIATTSRVVGLVGEHHRPEPELSFRARRDALGVSEVRAGARGAPAIVAVSRVLIVLFIVAGTVVIALGLCTPREDPRQRDLRPCTEPARVVRPEQPLVEPRQHVVAPDEPAVSPALEREVDPLRRLR